MKIIVEFLDGLFLTKKRERLQIDQGSTIDQLIEIISKRISKKPNEIDLKFKRDGYILKVVKGWDLNFYEIRENSLINVEIRENEDQKQRKYNEQINAKYMNKLFPQNQMPIKNSVIEEDQNDSDSQAEENTQQNNKESGEYVCGTSNSEDSQYDESNQSPMKLLSFRKMCDMQLEDFLKLTKTGQIEDVVSFLEKNIPSEFDKDQVQTYKENKLKLINQNGNGGWNAFHFAIFCNQIEIVKLFLEKNVEINKITIDGWSPLQLAIHKQNIEIVKILLSTDQVHVNELTAKGTALHITCKLGIPEILTLLLEKGADLDQKNDQHRRPSQICHDDDCQSIIKLFRESNSSVDTFKFQIKKAKEEKKEKEEQIKKIQNLSELEKLCIQLKIFIPPKPPTVIGKVTKIGSLMFTKEQRFLVININDGVLLRFKSKDQYPLKPSEVIPLVDIQDIKAIQPSVLMDKNLHYFEIVYDSRLVFCCQTQHTAKLWIYYIFKAACYSQFLHNLEERNLNIEHYIKKTEDIIELKDDNQQDNVIWKMVKEQLKLEEADKQQQIKNQENMEKIQKEQVELDKKKAQKNWIPKNNTKNSLKKSQDLQKQKELKSSQNQNGTKTPTQEMASPLKEKASPELPKIKQDDSNLDLQQQINILSKESVNFESFNILRLLGQGAFGKVFLVQKKDDKQLYAMKALKKRNLIIKKQLRFAVTEANVLKSVNHTFVMGLHYAFQTPAYLYLVMDYCPGGDLAQHILQKTTLDEDSSRFFIAELVLAIESLHYKNIIYRDLKPENILIAQDGHIKLADFGLSKENIGKGEQTTTFCGTPAYLSPEMVIKKRATPMSDIYGIGCCLFEMLTGDPPYYSDDIPTMYKQIKDQTLKYPSNISKTTKEFLRKILEKNPDRRLGAKGFDEIKNDPYFKGIDFNKLLQKEIQPPELTLDDEIEEELNMFVQNAQPRGKAIFKDADYDENNKRVNRVKNFTFVRTD